MTSDNKDELLAYEKKISELYHSDKVYQAEVPSPQLDSKIIAMANQQLSDNSNLLTKEQTFNQQQHVNKAKKSTAIKAWKWPFSLVASVGFLGVLLVTQRDYFIHPNDMIVGDTGILTEPVMLSDDVSIAETQPDETTTQSSFNRMQIAASAQKNENLLDKKLKASVREKLSINQTPKVLKEQMLDNSMLEENSVNISPMSLVDMSKLAELLKLELAIQKMSELEPSASSVKMQQTLFEHLAEYKKTHSGFKITEKYFNVLTEKQRQKLKSMATDVIPES